MKTISSHLASLRIFLISALLVILLFLPAACTRPNLDDLDAKVPQLSKPGTTLENVVARLGEPERYGWGSETFQKHNLPQTYVASYSNGLDVLISRGTVFELRAEKPGPGFSWQGKLRLGSSLDEVLEALGPPSKTLVGEPLGFAPNVLYKDIDGEPGHAYYARPDQHVRCFFLNNKIIGLYVMVEDPEGVRE